MLSWNDINSRPTNRLAIPKSDAHHPLAAEFKEFVQAERFPCVGAKSALNKGDITIVVGHSICGGADDLRVHSALLGFIARYRQRPDLFQSFVVIFDNRERLDEPQFEEALWTRVQALTDRDGALGHPWDSRVASDPDSPHFSLSVAGEAFFVVGLHPGASRPARRFARPALVFNLHDQFERLREAGRYEKLRRAILQRDEDSAGSPNPMIARHGEVSEARQYSGRAVEEGWTCPFAAPAPRALQLNSKEATLDP